MSLKRDTLTMTRDYAHPVDAVWQAWAEPDLKRAWFEFSDDPRATWEMEFEVGGHEAFSSAPGVEPAVTYSGDYHDIVPGQRIVLTTVITIGGAASSVSVSAAEFEATDSGTRLTVTEQVTFFDGREDAVGRRGGMATQLDRLANHLREPSAAG